MKVSIIMLLLFLNTSYAGVIKPITVGDLAPISGFIIDHAQEKKFRQINEEKKLLEKKVVTLEQLGELQNERVKFYKEMQSVVLLEYKKKQSTLFWNRTIYFIGGVFVTGFISYAAMKYGRQ